MAKIWHVSKTAAGQRADRALAEHLDETRSRVRRWILQGHISLAAGSLKPSTSLSLGDQLLIEPPGPADPRLLPEAGDLEFLHADADLLVLNKPAGLTMHPGAGRPAGTLANRLLHRYPEIAGVGGPGRPGIVHRLDKDTTGVVVVARSTTAYRQLSTAFAQREIKKTYLAIVYGEPRHTIGRIDLPIGRHPTERKKMAVVAHGRPALTLYRSLAASAGLAFLELDLQTGRTHQIRVHLKAIGHPLVGDPVYGEARWRGRPRMGRKQLEGFPRPALHAWKLEFEHPTNGRQVSFEAPVPADIQALWQAASHAPWPLSQVG